MVGKDVLRHLNHWGQLDRLACSLVLTLIDVRISKNAMAPPGLLTSYSKELLVKPLFAEIVEFDLLGEIFPQKIFDRFRNFRFLAILVDAGKPVDVI